MGMLSGKVAPKLRHLTGFAPAPVPLRTPWLQSRIGFSAPTGSDPRGAAGHEHCCIGPCAGSSNSSSSDSVRRMPRRSRSWCSGTSSTCSSARSQDQISAGTIERFSRRRAGSCPRCDGGRFSSGPRRSLPGTANLFSAAGPTRAAPAGRPSGRRFVVLPSDSPKRTRPGAIGASRASSRILGSLSLRAPYGRSSAEKASIPRRGGRAFPCTVPIQ